MRTPRPLPVARTRRILRRVAYAEMRRWSGRCPASVWRQGPASACRTSCELRRLRRRSGSSRAEALRLPTECCGFGVEQLYLAELLNQTANCFVSVVAGCAGAVHDLLSSLEGLKIRRVFIDCRRYRHADRSTCGRISIHEDRLSGLRPGFQDDRGLEPTPARGVSPGAWTGRGDRAEGAPLRQRTDTLLSRLGVWLQRTRCGTRV